MQATACGVSRAPLLQRRAPVEEVVDGEPSEQGERTSGRRWPRNDGETAATAFVRERRRRRSDGEGERVSQGCQREWEADLIPTPTCPIAVAGRGRRGARQLRADGHGGAGQVEDDVPVGWAGHCCSGPNALGLFHSFFSVIFTCCFPFSFGTKYFL
jgi:hypothetical protein